MIATAAAAAALALAAPPVGNYSLCALYVNQTLGGFEYGVISPTGHLKSLIELPGLFAVFDGTAAGAEEGTFYSYCGYGPPPQTSTGVLEVNWLLNTTIYRTITMPSEYAGNFFTQELNTDWSGASLGLVSVIRGITGPNDDPTWSAIASVDPTTGAATVLRNLTLEEDGYKWVKTGCSAFDSATRTFYLIAGVGASEAETVLGYDAQGSAPVSIPFPTTYDAIALQWSVYFKALVALAYERNAPAATFSWLVQDASDPTGWRASFTWPADSVFLSGMGETDIEDAGRIVAAAFTVPEGAKKERDIVSFVDLVGGAEIQRVNVTNKMVVADLEFCDPKA